MKELLNPMFIFKKRYSILTRLKEFPNEVLWNIIYNLLCKGYLYHPDFMKLNSIRNIHAGKKCLLIGNGPSVRVSDLEKLEKVKDVITISANKFYMCYDDTNFRPDYNVSADQQMIEDYGEEMCENNGRQFFISIKKPINIHGANTWIKLKHGRPFKFSKNLPKKIMIGGGTLIGALQLAYWMGIRKFYLYGVDHNFTYITNNDVKNNDIRNAKGDNNHFIKNYRDNKPWQAPQMDLVEQTFKVCDKILRSEGGFLINATREGNLDILERKNFDEILVYNK